MGPVILVKKNLQPPTLRGLMVFQKFRIIEEKNVKDPRNFLQAKRILTVVRVDPVTQQIWSKLRETNSSFDI